MSKQHLLLRTVIGLLAITGVVGGVFAVRQATRYFSQAQQNTTQPLNLTIDNITDTRVVISWTTQEPALSLIQYGTNPTQLTQTQSELSSTTNHRLVLNQLNPATKYFFKIQVGKQVFDQDGKPYTFTTTDPAQSTFSLEQLRQAFGTNDPQFDLNHDGVVNTHDYSLYLQQQPK